MKTVRFGLVGCGYFGSGMARIVHSLEGAEVRAVYGGSRAAALAEELHCDLVDSLDELMDREDIDAIIVASPSHAHREPVISAAKKGKHVFCEKPFALTLLDCEDMLAACREAEVHVMVGHIMHFMEGIGTVKQLIADGEIGRPIVCHAERTGWEEKQPVVSWKKKMAASGGHIFHHIHDLDVIQTILGPAVKICTTGGNLAHEGEGFGDEDDVLLLLLEFDGGAVASMQYGSGFRWGEHYIKINGTEGAIRIDMKRASIELRKNGSTSLFPLYGAEYDQEVAKANEERDSGIAYGTASSALPRHLADMMRRELACFRDVVSGKPIDDRLRLLFDGTSARSSIASAEAALVSLREQAWIRIETGLK
ncbi:Gfo/Idh/MocA family protein [Paenibacillus eucommiae]|uniref:Dehydrogenase n=1 Tax=Paenibacillus eucommiae TaxID=1355755 RepID=A0ABS4J560_9BACL|nr:Gfo/Idh/MocA family oxidoreductase [Paenibacillus eucommiae]MBP1993929.1 putative dehydrogenase [Paenibacillus eucommiae]